MEGPFQGSNLVGIPTSLSTMAILMKKQKRMRKYYIRT